MKDLKKTLQTKHYPVEQFQDHRDHSAEFDG